MPWDRRPSDFLKCKLYVLTYNAYLKTLGSDRAGYRMWHEKLVNSFAQVNNQYRGILESIAKGIDHDLDMSMSTVDKWDAWVSKLSNAPPHDKVDMGSLNEDLYAVLMDKTEGEAWQRVRAVNSGHGLEAFVRIYKWFMGTSGQGLSEKARIIMSPSSPKAEGDIAEAVDKWLGGLRNLQGQNVYI